MTKEDFLLSLYQEHMTQARQHETMRERATGLTVALAAAVLTFAVKGGIDSTDASLGWALLVIGLLGAVVSLKHYERNRLHVEIGAAFRRELESSLAIAAGEVRTKAETSHDAKYPRLRKIRLNIVWSLFSLLVSIAGLCVVLAASGVR